MPIVVHLSNGSAGTPQRVEYQNFDDFSNMLAHPFEVDLAAYPSRKEAKIHGCTAILPAELINPNGAPSLLHNINLSKNSGSMFLMGEDSKLLISGNCF